MKRLKPYGFFVLLLLVGFVWLFAQTSEKETPKPEEPTAFQTRCSICHSLKEVRTGMEKIMKEMHQKAGVEISDSSLHEIEATFTLLPMEDPHKGLFQEKCGKCHSLDKVVKAHQTKDSAEMKKIIEKMATKKGSGISKEEIDKINQSMFMLNEIYEPDVELKKEEKK
jgi:nitrate/TMAO reductase-like tetraheme cytochrome c subunit